MPQPVQTIYADNPGAIPAQYTLPPGLDLDFASSRAKVNGGGASGDFIMVLELLTSDGKIMLQARTDQTFSAGDTGVVSWAPFLRRAGASTPPSAVSAGIAQLTSSVVAPGVFESVAFDTFVRNDAAVFGSSVTSGGAESNTAGDKFLMLKQPGYYLLSAEGDWDGDAINQETAFNGPSGGLGLGDAQNSAIMHTPTALFDGTLNLIGIAVQVFEGTVYVGVDVADGGSGNDVEVTLGAMYLPADDVALVF